MNVVIENHPDRTVTPDQIDNQQTSDLDRSPSICSNAFVKRGRTLAIDYGSKNIGLACCDELGVAVRPLASIPNRGLRDLLKQLKQALDENAIEYIAMGMPLNMDGSQGEASRQVQHFIDHGLAALGLPIAVVDERLSTVEAREAWTAMSARQQRRYRTVDSLAAAFILKRYLEES